MRRRETAKEPEFGDASEGGRRREKAGEGGRRREKAGEGDEVQRPASDAPTTVDRRRARDWRRLRAWMRVRASAVEGGQGLGALDALTPLLLPAIRSRPPRGSWLPRGDGLPHAGVPTAGVLLLPPEEPPPSHAAESSLNRTCTSFCRRVDDTGRLGIQVVLGTPSPPNASSAIIDEAQLGPNASSVIIDEAQLGPNASSAIIDEAQLGPDASPASGPAAPDEPLASSPSLPSSKTSSWGPSEAALTTPSRL